MEETGIDNSAIAEINEINSLIESMNTKYEQRLYEKVASIRYHILLDMMNSTNKTFEVKTKTLIKMLSKGWPLFYKNRHLASEVIKSPVEQVVEVLKYVDASLNNKIVTQDHYKTLDILTENLLSRQSASCVLKEEAIRVRYRYNLGFDCLYEPKLNELVLEDEGLVNKLVEYGFRIGEFSICAKRLSEVREDWATTAAKKLKKGSVDYI